MEKLMAKVFFEKEVLIGGVPTLKLFNVTTPAGDQGQYVAALCNGLPFWWFASIPSGKVIGCDFTDAPIATGSYSTNNGLIDAITVLPGDVLTYA
jgi:hypothetical protein